KAPKQGAIKMPDLPAASATIASEPPKVAVDMQQATRQTPQAESPAGTTHVVAAGDTYWNLAKALYGDPALWRKIAEANPALRARTLPIGATLKIPAKSDSSSQ